MQQLSSIIGDVKIASTDPRVKSDIMKAVSTEQISLSGLKAVYNAILRRQGEQARLNMITINADRIRENEEIEL
jgi:hypothetical protein